jgi:hypothetical protein
MNRTNSLITFASITLTTLLVLNTIAMVNVSAIEDQESYSYPESKEYTPQISNEYYDNYESGHYEDRYGKSYYIG